jgi:hypothetical protein
MIRTASHSPYNNKYNHTYIPIYLYTYIPIYLYTYIPIYLYPIHTCLLESPTKVIAYSNPLAFSICSRRGLAPIMNTPAFGKTPLMNLAQSPLFAPTSCCCVCCVCMCAEKVVSRLSLRTRPPHCPHCLHCHCQLLIYSMTLVQCF